MMEDVRWGGDWGEGNEMWKEGIFGPFAVMASEPG